MFTQLMPSTSFPLFNVFTPILIDCTFVSKLRNKHYAGVNKIPRWFNFWCFDFFSRLTVAAVCLCVFCVTGFPARVASMTIQGATILPPAGLSNHDGAAVTGLSTGGCVGGLVSFTPYQQLRHPRSRSTSLLLAKTWNNLHLCGDSFIGTRSDTGLSQFKVFR